MVPTRSLRTGNDNSGVRTAKGATTLAAASMSAAPMGGFWTDSGIRNLYRGRRRAGKTIQREFRRYVNSGGEMRVFRAKFGHLAFRRLKANIQGMLDKDPRGGLPGVGGGEFNAIFP